MRVEEPLHLQSATTTTPEDSVLTEIKIYLGQPSAEQAVIPGPKRNNQRRIICRMELEYWLDLSSYWIYRASHYFMISLVDDPAFLALIFV